MKLLKLNNSAATNSLLLTFVRLMTMTMGLLSIKLLSVYFSLQEYGTYSQAILVAQTITSLSILGLTDATNYFYNKTTEISAQKKYIATIFSIQCVIGIVCGILVIILNNPISWYFSNPDVKKYLIVIAFRPLLDNLIMMFQTLFVSIGKAKIIALRNFLVSLIRLITVAVACLIVKDIFTVICMSMIVDIVQVLYFYLLFRKYKNPIRISDADKKLIREILSFSIPMSIYVLTNYVSIHIDRYVIGAFTNTEMLAIYSNAARKLPFDILTLSLITVLIPILTRMINRQEYAKANDIFKLYLRIGYIITFIFVGGAIAVSKDLMLFLYDTKYLAGLSVFIIYLVVDMIRFANVTAILTGAGKTKILMTVSVVTMFLNAIFNVVGYKLWGFAGPAIVTLLLTIGMILMLLHFGAKEIKTTVIKLFNFKEITIVVIQIIIVGSGAYSLSSFMVENNIPYVIRFIACYGIYILVLGLLNYRRVIECYRKLNQYK